MSLAAPSPEDTEFYRAALHEIIGLAAALARRIHAEATAPEPAIGLEQASIALDRTARTLRRTVLLARRLHEYPPVPDRAAARRQVIRAVEDAIHGAVRTTPGRQAALDAELAERLDRPDFEHDLATRPVAELIQELARDLGVAAQGRTFVFRRRTPDDVAELAARAEAPGKPFPVRRGAGEGNPPAPGPTSWRGTHHPNAIAGTAFPP